jgi:putative Mg2+ transporter-C (MgtC) family protein
MSIIESFLFYVSSNDINTVNAVFRIIVSFLAGALIGIEREKTGHPAGLKTHILIAMGSTLFMIISIYIPQTFNNMSDPGRVAAQVISGIGFLGAGAILSLGVNVRGLTSAASIWIMSAIGLLIGVGLIELAVVSVFMVLFTLIVMDKFEEQVINTSVIKVMRIFVDTKKAETKEVLEILTKYHISVKWLDILQNIKESDLELKMLISIPNDLDYQKLFGDLYQVKNIYKVTLEYGFSEEKK